MPISTAGEKGPYIYCEDFFVKPGTFIFKFQLISGAKVSIEIFILRT